VSVGWVGGSMRERKTEGRKERDSE